MTSTHDSTAVQGDRQVIITHIFDAPQDLVFKVWTEPEHIAQWWSPKGFTTTVSQMDFRAGGTWRYVMHGPDGTEYPASGIFREIVSPERIVTTDESDQGFEQVIKTDLPSGVMVVTTLFEDLGNKTRLTIRILLSTVEDRRKHEEMGVISRWNSSFDCLDDYLTMF